MRNEGRVMKVINANEEHTSIALRIIKQSFSPLSVKYNDFKFTPSTKTLKLLIAEISHPTSDTYLLQNEKNYVGYARVKRSRSEYILADLCIVPSHQNKGYAQYFVKKLENRHPDAKEWSLVTILEEKRGCYLYVKLGYTQMNIIKEINPSMHLVLYKKDIK